MSATPASVDADHTAATKRSSATIDTVALTRPRTPKEAGGAARKTVARITTATGATTSRAVCTFMNAPAEKRFTTRQREPRPGERARRITTVRNEKGLGVLRAQAGRRRFWNVSAI